MSAAGNPPRRVLLDAQDAGRLAVVFHDQRFDVEHDIGDVFDHAVDRGEFVLGVVDFDLRDGAAFQAGSSTRRRPLPIVAPKPRSNGSATNLP